MTKTEDHLNIERAIYIILAEQKASVSLLQRKMQISYKYAFALINYLERHGAIGIAIGAYPRVLNLEKLNTIASALHESISSVNLTGDAISEKAVIPSGEESPSEPALSADASSSFKPAVYVYLPPNVGRFNTNAFLENLHRNPPKYPLVTFSECWSFIPTIKLKHSPEIAVAHAPVGGAKDPLGRNFSIHNLVWYWAMCFAWSAGYSHVLYLEEDVRVKGANWDEAIFGEFLNDAPNALLSGTMAVYNPCNTDREFWLRYCDVIASYNTEPDKSTAKGRNFPIPTWGWKGKSLPPITGCTQPKSLADSSGSCVFVNGAGGIYSVAGFRDMFPEITYPHDNETKLRLATTLPPFDMEIGKRIFAKYRAQSFDMVHHNTLVYSAFSNVITTEEERLTMLREGAVRLVHSVKGNVVE